MLAPLVVTTPMPSAGLPSWRTTKLGGSTKPWVTVAISPSRNTRPLLSTGVSATALTPSSAPVTRSGTRCEEVSTVPAGTTLFCLASELNSACGVIPSVASLACENSTKILSSWVP